jgi:hypothetical protein
VEKCGDFIMKLLQRYAWIFLFAVGLALLYYAYDNIIAIPALSPNDPERGWEWLTRDPEVIDYIKFWFRLFGFWVLAVAVQVLVISATGYRKGQKWAFYSMLYLPVHVVIHMFIWPWLAPIMAIILLMIIAGLVLPFRQFFPKN